MSDTQVSEQQSTPQSAPQASPVVQTEFQFEQTGHPSLDYALRYLGKQGIGPEHPAVLAAQKGSWEAMDVLAKERNLDQDVLNLGKFGFQDLQGKQQAQAAGFQSELDATAKQAGLADWAAVREFAKANATPDELKAVNDVLAKGDAAAKLLAQALAQRAASVPTNRDGAAATKPSATTVAPVAGAVTQEQYNKSLIELQRKHGVRYSLTPEFRSLVESRLAARARGIN